MLVFPQQFLFFLSYLTHNSLDEFNTFVDHLSTSLFLPVSKDVIDARNTSVPFDSLAKAVQPGDQPETCAPCLQSTMQKYFEAVTARTDNYCEKTRCPFIMEACRQRKRYADIADGALLEIAKVPQLSFAYCVGNAQCKIPDTPHDNLTFFPHEEANMTEFLAEEEDSVFCDMESKGCFETAMCKAVRRGVRRARNLCNRTKCPYLQQLCSWGNTHRPWAFGILIGKIQPWKYAMGKCE